MPKVIHVAKKLACINPWIRAAVPGGPPAFEDDDDELAVGDETAAAAAAAAAEFRPLSKTGKTPEAFLLAAPLGPPVAARVAATPRPRGRPIVKSVAPIVDVERTLMAADALEETGEPFSMPTLFWSQGVLKRGVRCQKQSCQFRNSAGQG